MKARRHSILALILVGSGCLNLWNTDFPLGYHGDEPKKITHLQTGTQDFHHPILMLQTARLANLALGIEDSQKLAVLGRVCNALAGVLIVFLSYCIARRIAPPGVALLSAAAVAVSPTLVIHAHYFKEDVLFTAMALMSLVAFMRLVERADSSAIAQFGIATGLAMSAHYKSLLLVALYVAFPVFGRVTHAKSYYPSLLWGLVLSAFVFELVNWPLFMDPDVFIAGVLHEGGHVVRGHTIEIGPLSYGFGFHLVFSLVPGMTVAMVALGLWQIGHILWHWATASWEERLLVAYVALFYAVPEIVPLKPWPDFGRYVLPLVPVLICLACKGAFTIPLGTSKAWPRAAVLTAAIAYCLVHTVLLDYNLATDTRAAAAGWLADKDASHLGEHYSGTSRDVWSLADVDLNELRERGVRYVVASSFMYDRYYVGAKLSNQKPFVYDGHQNYCRLFEHPYVEFKPAYMSFVFSNPTIRIVDLEGRPKSPSLTKR